MCLGGVFAILILCVSAPRKVVKIGYMEAKNERARTKYASDEAHRQLVIAKASAYVNADEKRLLGRDLRAIRFARLRDTGCSQELWEALTAFQNGCCAVCKRPVERGLHPDGACADHWEPGGVKTPRGILCRACNTSLGVYENRQRPAGLRFQPYEDYLTNTPVMQLEALK